MNTETKIMYWALVVYAVVCLVILPLNPAMGLGLLISAAVMSPVPWFVDWSGKRFNRD